MATHLSTQGRLTALCFYLFHLGFDQRVTRFVHQGFSARSANGRGQTLRAFHIKQNGAIGHSTQYVLGKQLHLPVWVNGFTILCNDTQSVAIAIKRQSQLCP